MVAAEATEEMGVGDEAAPPLADERGAGEGGRQRREAKENLGQDVVVVQCGLWLRRGRETAAPAAHRVVLAAIHSCSRSMEAPLVRLRWRRINAEGAAPPGTERGRPEPESSGTAEVASVLPAGSLALGSWGWGRERGWAEGTFADQ